MNQADAAIHTTARHILDHHFDVGATDVVCIIFDGAKEKLAAELGRILRADGATVESVDVTCLDGPSAERAIADVLDDRNRCSMVLCSPEMWRGARVRRRFTMFRGAPSLVTSNRCLFFDAVTPLASLLRMYGPSYPSGISRLQELATELPSDTRIRVTTASGTDITGTARDWQIDRWLEIHTSPVEGTLDGVIVADVACPFGRLDSPIRLVIQKGRLTEIRPEDPLEPMAALYVRDMQKHLASTPANAALAEIGVGACAGAKPSDTLMETESVEGTVHFCFGDNTRYGGNNASEWHGGTVVCSAPTITAHTSAVAV